MSESQARARARERFGDIPAFAPSACESERRLIQRERRMTVSEEIGSDIRMAVRSARRTRGFTATALLTIALGVGATTAVFSIVRGVLVRPLPYPGADRIVRVFGAVNNLGRAAVVAELSRPRGAVAKLSARSAAYVWNEATVTGLGEPLRTMTAAVYGDFFGALGVRPALGRGADARRDAHRRTTSRGRLVRVLGRASRRRTTARRSARHAARRELRRRRRDAAGLRLPESRADLDRLVLRRRGPVAVRRICGARWRGSSRA